MNEIIEFLVSVFIFVGVVFVLVGFIGLVWLLDFYLCLYGLIKVSILGVGGVIFGLLLFFFW